MPRLKDIRHEYIHEHKCGHWKCEVCERISKREDMTLIPDADDFGDWLQCPNCDAIQVHPHCGPIPGSFQLRYAWELGDTVTTETPARLAYGTAYHGRNPDLTTIYKQQGDGRWLAVVDIDNREGDGFFQLEVDG